jgi:ligand-binding sensor domain-containing protein
MWIGAIGGAARFDGREFVTYTREQGWPLAFIYAIHRSADGVLWFGTQADGALRYNPNTGERTQFTTNNGLADKMVVSLARDTQGAMWFGHPGGWVTRYDGKEYRKFQGRGWVGNILPDEDGKVLLATSGGGLSRFNGSEFEAVRSESGEVNGSYLSMHRDPDGGLWLGGPSTAAYLKDGKLREYGEIDGFFAQGMIAAWFGLESAI